jgi:hypothetical protein
MLLLLGNVGQRNNINKGRAGASVNTAPSNITFCLCLGQLKTDKFYQHFLTLS